MPQTLVSNRNSNRGHVDRQIAYLAHLPFIFFQFLNKLQHSKLVGLYIQFADIFQESFTVKLIVLGGLTQT